MSEKISEVTCPQCKKEFVLVWNEYTEGDKKQSLFFRGCPSGGIYDCYIGCPYCDYVEEL